MMILRIVKQKRLTVRNPFGPFYALIKPMFKVEKNPILQLKRLKHFDHYNERHHKKVLFNSLHMLGTLALGYHP